MRTNNMQIVNRCVEKFGNQRVSSGDLYQFLRAENLAKSFAPLMEYKIGRGVFQFVKAESASVTQLSDEELSARIKSRFTTLEKMTHGCTSSIVRSMIVTGPGGLGKSFTVENVVSQLPEERVRYIKGYVRPTGLYRTLYEARFKRCVVVFDDADSIFADEVAINLLKAACDSSDKRVISWLSQAELMDEGGDIIPNRFEFEGSVIFISNKDFSAEIDRSGKLAPHFEALISRSHYIDLGIKTPRDYILRIKQVIADGMMSEIDVNLRDQIVDFIEDNQNKMRELSLRMVLKLADLAKIDPKGWKEMATVTCMRV